MIKRTSYKNKAIVLTMPVFNEEIVIEEVVRKNFDYVRKFPKGQLVISEDGSTDKTKIILKRLKKRLDFVLHMSSKRKGAVQGQKNALKHALDLGADLTLLTDSDNQHDPNDFDKLLTQADKNNMVIGWKKPRNDPYWRKYGSKIWNFYVRLLFGMKLHDLNCGFRVIDRAVLTTILQKCKTFQECFPTELSIRAKYAGFRLTEVPIKHFMRGDKPKAWNPKKIPAIAANLLIKSLELRKELFFRKKNNAEKFRLTRMKETYDDYYKEGYSFREDWFGPITEKYIIPKYVELVADFVKNNNKKIAVLELGAGDGEVTDLIKDKRPQWTLVPTEVVESAVKSLRGKGYRNAVLADATNLPFKDNSFDFVICFDVMHHVDKPTKMASEMIRVARRGAFLIEANKKSIPRRLLEKTRKYKLAGEKSYYPEEYKAFFKLPEVMSVKITPFQFIPPKLSTISLSFTIFLSELISRLPVLCWQCSGLAICVEKKFE